MVIQILITSISVFVIARACEKFKQKAVPPLTWLAWSLFWLLIIFFIWQPQQTDRIAAVLQVGRGADAVLYLSLILIFYLFFRVFTKLEKLDQDITLLIREIAILDKKHPKA